jgi:hypothetical protein
MYRITTSYVVGVRIFILSPLRLLSFPLSQPLLSQCILILNSIKAMYSGSNWLIKVLV